MANWFYYNDDGDKISVTGKELKELAERGVIRHGTIVENPEGKTAPAKKVKGLTFSASPVPSPTEHASNPSPSDKEVNKTDGKTVSPPVETGRRRATTEQKRPSEVQECDPPIKVSFWTYVEYWNTVQRMGVEQTLLIVAFAYPIGAIGLLVATVASESLPAIGIFLILLLLIAGGVGLGKMVKNNYVKWKEDVSDPVAQNIALDIMDLQRTGKLGNRSEAAKRVHAERYAETAQREAQATKREAERERAVPNAGSYPTFSEAPGHILSIKQLDNTMDHIETQDIFRDIDETTRRYIKELMAEDPRRWAGYLERQEQYTNTMNKNLMTIVTGTSDLIEKAYRYFDHPSTPSPSPEYLQAFDAKINEWRQFIADR